MVTLAQLLVFRRLCECGSFSQAAEALHVTQPAVSQQIRALQDHFGLRLVEVVKGRARLTDAGRFLAARSEQLLAGALTLERDMREFSETQVGTLHLGATVTIGTHGLAPLLSAFNESHPGIDVQMTIGNTDSIVASVRRGDIALALVEGPASGDDIEILPYEKDELVLIVPASGHRFSRRRSVRARDLAGERFIMREPGSGTRTLVEAALGRAGVTPHNVLELPSGEAIARAVESNLGISIVSRMVVEHDEAMGRLGIVRVDDVDFKRTFRMIRSRAYTPSPSAGSFQAVVRAHAEAAGLT
jgi:DNA-binding transcriptional LysR family regulator